MSYIPFQYGNKMWQQKISSHSAWEPMHFFLIFYDFHPTYLLTETTSELFRHSLCHRHCGNTTRLSAADFSRCCITGLGQILGDLSCLSWTSLTNDYQNLVVRYSLKKTDMEIIVTMNRTHVFRQYVKLVKVTIESNIY